MAGGEVPTGCGPWPMLASEYVPGKCPGDRWLVRIETARETVLTI